MQHHGIGSSEAVLDGLNFPSVSCAVIAVDEPGQIIALDAQAADWLQLWAEEHLPRPMEVLPRSFRGAGEEVIKPHHPVPGRPVTPQNGGPKEYRFWVPPLPRPPATKKMPAAIAVLHDVT